MFKIIPSISISDGKVVKARGGDLDELLKYNYSPIDIAQLFQDSGMNVLNFVDLDGAKKETPVNYHVLEAISGHTEMEVDYSGGIRTDGDINKVLEYGATYFTAASVAASNRDLFTSWIFSYGREKISLSADSIDEKIIIRAWKNQTEIDLYDHISYFYERGLKYLKVLDITKEGLLEGPNFELYQKVRDKYPDASIAAIGGVRSMDDIKRLKDMGLYAVIIGRALYEEKIKLKEIRQLLEEG